ncbi:hypothetical protein KVR01_007951 [Diaporthe batatas]|uniref:uncharacterized protein n=1 Tax=Diaporthe batatas TaxID=748121 RepID=UPI001D04FA0C|nr:uncharacterized protein KVR01_007951 [Diaporthe batatas]KAG8162186.1 hypothetical protein KVR01_007951 [Diaporthe batatas]
MSAINRENARDVLSNILSNLSTPSWWWSGSHYQGYPRYQGLFDIDDTRPSHRPGRDIAAVRDLLFASMRDEVFEIFGEPNMMPRKETLWKKAGDISKAQRGIYLHIIEGTDNRLRFFVGQSDNMSFHIRRQLRNSRYRRENSSLHGYAMQKSRWDYFVILAVLPPGPTAAEFTDQEQALLANILCMWCALLSCTLQPSTMEGWQAGQANRMPWTGLNLACPLDHGAEGQYVNWRHALSESEDSLKRSYVTEVLDKRRELTPFRGLVLGLGIGVFVAVWIASLRSPHGRRGK